MTKQSTADALEHRLLHGPPLLIDGGTGTELEQRGAGMHPQAWSARVALTDAPVLREVHAAYLEAGAEIIIANTYAANYHVMEHAGLWHEFRLANQRSVELALQVREAADHRPDQVWVAGGMSTTTFTDGIDRSLIERVGNTAAGYREHARVIADSGADFLILEMMRDVTETLHCLEAALETGLPVWLGISAQSSAGGELSFFGSADPLSPGVARILAAGMQPQAVGVMHSEIDITSRALQTLREHWNGPLFAYPHRGVFELPHWRLDDTLSPAEFAEAATQWLDCGVTAVGGCCGVRPEHIAALNKSLKR